MSRARIIFPASTRLRITFPAIWAGVAGSTEGGSHWSWVSSISAEAVLPLVSTCRASVTLRRTRMVARTEPSYSSASP